MSDSAPNSLGAFIENFVQREVAQAGTQTHYREPLVGFANAADPRFLQLREVAEPTHMLPIDLLPTARSVVAFFVPFASAMSQAVFQTKVSPPLAYFIAP